MVLDDRRLTVKQIAKPIGISSGLVYTVLTEILGMNKLCGRWVPRILKLEDKLSSHELYTKATYDTQRNPCEHIKDTW